MLNLLVDGTNVRLLKKQNQNQAHKKRKNSRMFFLKIHELRSRESNLEKSIDLTDFGALTINHLKMVTEIQLNINLLIAFPFTNGIRTIHSKTRAEI